MGTGTELTCAHIVPVLLDFVKPSHTNGHVEFLGISPKSLSLEYIATEPLIIGEATPVLLFFTSPCFRVGSCPSGIALTGILKSPMVFQEKYMQYSCEVGRSKVEVLFSPTGAGVPQ